MKRPSDTNIKKLKILFGVMLIIIGILVIAVQGLKLKNSIVWITLTEEIKPFISYWILWLWAIPITLWGLDINILSRGRTRILQMIFWIFLMILSGIFQDTPTLSADILYFLLGLIAFFVGITGKCITKQWLKTGQKITKIRV